METAVVLWADILGFSEEKKKLEEGALHHLPPTGKT